MRQIIQVVFLLAILPLLAQAETLRSYTLGNGLRIIVKPDHRAPLVVSQIWYGVGGLDERLGQTGLSHLLEHLMFKGTRQFPKGAISKFVSDHGGYLNAMTSQDFTVYFEVIGKAFLPRVLALEADRMQHLQIKPDEFKRELQVVLEERRLRTEDRPIAQLVERFHAHAFVSSPYHHPVIGWMHDIRQLTRKDALTWYRAWYAPNNAVLVVVGDVKPRQVLALAKRYFAKLRSVKRPSVAKPKSIKPLGSKHIQVNLVAKLPHLLLGYPTPTLKTAAKAKDAYALTVLATILGQGPQSRLQSELVRGTEVASFASADYSLLGRLDNLLTIHAVPSQKFSLKILQKSFCEPWKGRSPDGE